jgi:hypothetical protein
MKGAGTKARVTGESEEKAGECHGRGKGQYEEEQIYRRALAADREADFSAKWIDGVFATGHGILRLTLRVGSDDTTAGESFLVLSSKKWL